MSIDWSDLWNDTLIRILPDGAAAPRVLWVALALAGLYVVSFLLCFALKLPGNARVLHTAPELSDDAAAPAPAV